MVDWNVLVEEHGPLVVGISWRILGNAADVEDNVQEVFLAAWRYQETHQVRHWPGLLRRLTTVGALAKLRKRRHHTPLEELALAGVGAPPEEQAIEKELEENLRHAVADLPEREAAVFTLRFFEDLDLREIAASLSIGYSAAAKALSRARSRLQRLFSDSNGERI